MSLVLLLCVVLLAWEVDCLTCKCSSCTGNDFCVVDSPNGRCAAMVFRGSDINETILQTRCFNSTESSAFCNISNSNLAIQCCSEHFCNVDLRPTLIDIDTSPTTPAATVPAIKPTLVPGPTTEKPTANTPIKCHRYNSNKPPRDYPFCNTVSGSCFRLQRLASNGTVIQEKQGCINDCVNEKRNRVIKECCNTTLCNGAAPPLPPVEKPSPTITQTNTPIFSKVTTAVSSSTRLIPILATQSSSTQLSFSTSSKIIRNPTPAITNSEVITLTRDSEFESVFSVLVPLCIVYLFVTILVISLVVVICYKQRQIRQLETTVRVMKVTQKQPQSGSYNERTTSTSSNGSTPV